MGKTGKLWQKECVEAFGYEREDVLICNVLRCGQVKNQYPIGKLRIKAEEYCREWDDKLMRYDPQVSILTYHPAFTFRVPQVMKLIVAAFRVAWDLSEQGFRPIVIMGEKGIKAKGLEFLRTNFHPPESSMKNWQRHIVSLS